MKYIKAMKHTVEHFFLGFLCNVFFKEICYYILSVNTVTCTPRIKVEDWTLVEQNMESQEEHLVFILKFEVDEK